MGKVSLSRGQNGLVEPQLLLIHKNAMRMLSAPHSALRTPHSALRTPHSALRTPHSALRTPHSALRTPHSALRTPHSALRSYGVNGVMYFPILMCLKLDPQPVCTTKPQILIVICCIHLHIHHMSRIPFLILSSLDFVVFVVTTLIFH